jgi:hypothetical protein
VKPGKAKKKEGLKDKVCRLAAALRGRKRIKVAVPVAMRIRQE